MNFNSITFKISSMLFLSSAIFILFIALMTNNAFTKSYKSLEEEKISTIIDYIAPSISLNLSYGFSEAIDEIGNRLVNNPDILFAQIDVIGSKSSLLFTKHKNSLSQWKKSKAFILTKTLTDPSTLSKIGEITLVYSNSSFEQHMKSFYRWLAAGIITFSISMILLSFLLIKALRPLVNLASDLKKFNPYNPKQINLITSNKDEVSSISNSVNIMIENIIEYVKNTKLLSKKILQKENHLKEAQRIANVGSWEYNVIENKLSLSDEIYRLLGINLNVVIDWNEFLSFISAEEQDYIQTIFKSAIQKGSNFDIKYSLTLEKNCRINIQTRGKVRKKTNGSIIITAVSMDITQDIRNKLIIEKLAYYDSLTSLPNRVLLKDRIRKAIQNAKRKDMNLAVLFLDLDHFKLINDTLGHNTGDDLLIYISTLLKSQIKESDTLARIGGDEFVVLLSDANSKENVIKTANNLLNILDVQHIVNSHQLYITTSIGIAMYPSNANSMEELITNADTAMYNAKQNGRNNYKLYSPSMGNHISKQMIIEQDLREAVNSKVGFEVFYQVIINSKDNSISGAEALVRWNHPNNGLVFPNDFIHVAESTGIILNLGNWIIEESIHQLNRWNKLGFNHLKLSINLSARQFQNNGLTSFILSMIQKYNIKAYQLEFEITESLSMANMSATLRILNELKNIGVSLAIDDFGTGYSSLSYLKQFPLHTIKIDKSFISNITTNDNDKIITKTIILMAHSLNFSTVAKGVEIKEHADLLKEMGCEQLQGYYFSKPIQKNEFYDFLKHYE
ncbi:MAG: EAL domain-containing protein [Sulfurimonas sp.]|nr:EAL domain-containing protein [Sulfurimonas sp.]